jgi:hypothetical protein
MQAKGKAPAKAEPAKTTAPAKADPKKDVPAKPTGTATPKDPKTNTNSKAGSSMPSAQNSKATLDVKKKENDSKTLNSQPSTAKLANNTTPPPATPKKQEPKVEVEQKKEEVSAVKAPTESIKQVEPEPTEKKVAETKLEAPQKKIERSFDTTKFTVENVEFFPSYTPVISKKVDPPALIETKIEKPVESPTITDTKVEPIKQEIPQVSQTFPAQEVAEVEKIPPPKLEKEVKAVQALKIVRKSINKNFLIRHKKPENTRNDQRALYNKLVSPKQKQGVSIFSNYHSVLESLMTADTHQFLQSPNERSSKVMFDKNFNADMNENFNVIVSSPHLRNPNSKIIADQINYLKSLKQSKLSMKSEPSLLVPSNTITKSAILNSDTNFENEYKSILDRQKLNSKNQKIMSSTVGKVSFAQKAMISSQKLEGRFKGSSTITISPEDSLKKKGLSSKGADLYMKLNDKVRW